MGELTRVPVEDGAPGGAAEPRRNGRFQHLYYAFLSYSHQDRELADWLHKELEKFRVPRSLAGRLTVTGVVPRRLAPVFRDRHELAAADDLGVEIKAALAASQFLIVLCSPAAARSRWVNAEIEAFKHTRPDGCVLAAIASGEPFASETAGAEQDECFPPALRHKYDRRGRATGRRAEPIAADLRDQGDGRRNGFLKLVAGMLGVGLDDLVHREASGRHRRLGYLAAASLAGMVVTSGLALTAIQARDAARDQRREAEGLVAFMVGDLRAKLEPIGRLDALDGVGSRVLAYYSKQDTSGLSDAALLQRSRALSLMAEVAYLRGNLDEAEGLYRQALAGTTEAVRRSPNDSKRLFDHAQNVFWVGEIARARGQPDQALGAYREYKRLADRLIALEPDNLKWRMEGLYGIENIGIALYNLRRFDEASRQFESALRPMERLASVDDGNLTYQKELSTLLAWLADAERARGNLDTAIAVRGRQIGLLDRAVAGGATDVGLRQQRIPARQALGVLLTSRGQTERGIEQYRIALEQAAALTAIEPTNSKWSGTTASVRLQLATNLLELSQRDEAAREASNGCEIANALSARDASVARLRVLQTTCLGIRARLALASGANAEALRFAERALTSAGSERSGDAAADRYSVAGAYRLLGDVRRRGGDLDGAKAAWSAGLAQLPKNVTERPWEMSERAELLRRLGRGSEASPIAAKLAAIGYRSVS